MKNPTNSICKILIVCAGIILSLVVVSQIEFTLVIKKNDSGFLQSVTRLLNGAVGTYKSITNLGGE